MNETAKAMRRRFLEDQNDEFSWMRLFQGEGIDVGCGPDKLPFDKCRGFDKADGDANKLHTYFPPESFRYLHASQALEHMVDPVIALKSWLQVVKKGGHLIISIPDFILYEQLNWPSRFNGDHKSTWSMWLPNSPSRIHCFLPKWLEQFPVDVKLCHLVDNNYDYKKLGTGIDQTIPEDLGVEAFIEFVLRKK